MSLLSPFHRVRATVAIMTAQLTRNRFRTVLAIVGIILAVLAATLLASAGAGVLETGQSQLQSADRDLWLTSGPVGLSATSGGFENTLYDAHNISRDLGSIKGVKKGNAIGFQTVYASTSGEEFSTIIATGATGSGTAVSISKGRGFPSSYQHYAGGSYDGPMGGEVIIDSQTAEEFSVGVGDTLFIGGTLATARSNEFEVVGISNTFSKFLGTPTITMPLSELQTVTGSTETDAATFITVKIEDGTEPSAAKQRIQEAYPALTTRTNQQQLNAVLQNQALVLAGALTLVVLAVIAGITLTTNLLGLVVYQQRPTLAALQAVGLSQSTLVRLIAGQGLVLGVIGGLLGVGLTIPAAEGLNRLGAALVGFDGLVQVSTRILIGGFGIATVVGTISAAVVAWRVSKLDTLEALN